MPSPAVTTNAHDPVAGSESSHLSVQVKLSSKSCYKTPEEFNVALLKFNVTNDQRNPVIYFELKPLIKVKVIFTLL